MTGRIRIGHCYLAQLSKKQAPVRVDSINPDGGWNVRNLETGRITVVREKDKFLRTCEDTDLETELKPNRRAQPKIGIVRNYYQEPLETLPEVSIKTATPQVATKTKKLSLLDVAHRILCEEGDELSTIMIVKTALEKGYWKTKGKTPHGTLHAAMSREIALGGDTARFAKGTRGKFVAIN